MRRQLTSATPESLNKPLKGKHLLLVAASVFIAGVLYLASAMITGLAEVTAAWYQAGGLSVVRAMILTLFGLTLRCLRWSMFLRMVGHNLPSSINAPIYLAGLSLTTVPGKLGEIIRSVFLRPHGVTYSKSIAAFFADRLSDLTGVLLAATILSWLVYPPARLLTLFAVGLIVGLIAFRMDYLPLTGYLLRLTPRSWRAEATLESLALMFEHLRTCLSLPVFGLGVVIAIVAFSAEGLALVFIVSALGGDVASPAVFFSFFVAILGGAASMIPAGLGAMEGTLAALLVHFGASLPSAVAATVLIRLTTLWFVVAIGLACLLWIQMRHRVAGDARPEAQP